MKRTLQLIACVISAPLIYGLLCLPLLGLFLNLFPAQLNEWGGTFEVPLVLGVEAIQALIIFLGGVTVALIAGGDSWARVCLIATTVDMLLIGVSVQRQYWESMPVWHHWVFFALIVTCLPAGWLMVNRMRSA